MRIAVDQDACCGSGNCVLTVPEVFGQRDDDGIVRLRQDNPDPELWDRVREAAHLCPAEAIRVYEKRATVGPSRGDRPAGPPVSR